MMLIVAISHEFVLAQSFDCHSGRAAWTDLPVICFSFFLDIHSSFANHVSLPSQSFPERPFHHHCFRDDSAQDEARGEEESH